MLRENNEVIVAGLLPFIVNSNLTVDFANSNAAGTMSKRVKWKDSANYEFLLPPKDQQAEIAELLWAFDSSIEQMQSFLEEIKTSLKTIRMNCLGVVANLSHLENCASHFLVSPSKIRKK